jgi:hypothetical protein
MNQAALERRLEAVLRRRKQENNPAIQKSAFG